jgi:hypothetical protein
MVSPVRGPERAQGRLEGGQTVADDSGLFQAGAAWSPFGVHRRADSLQRGERVIDPGTVGGVRRNLLVQSVERLGQIIGAPLDVGPPGGRVGGRPARCFSDAHRIMKSRAFGVGIGEPGLPAFLGRRAAAGWTGDPGDQADED